MCMDAFKFADIIQQIIEKGGLIIGILFAISILVGIIYRVVKKKPYEGTPPTGVLKDLPSSITGINKYK